MPTDSTQAQQLQQLADQSDRGNTSVRDGGTGNRQSVQGGDSVAKSSAQQGGGGSGGGGGGGGGGVGPISASLSDNGTFALTTGDVKAGNSGRLSFGDFNFAGKGATQTNGLTGSKLALIAGVLAVAGLGAVLLMRRRA